MARIIACGVLLATALSLTRAADAAPIPQNSGESFTLQGRVINAVTGEPVAGALVEYCCDRSAQFSRLDGTFQFSGLLSGRFVLSARKPGFFNDLDLHNGRTTSDTMSSIPVDGKVTLKLTPEGILFGEVRDEHGEPLERVQVEAKQLQVENGGRRLQTVSVAITNDMGSFRIAELKPGRYFLSFGAGRSGWSSIPQLSQKKPEETGYGLQFYPGVPDIASATPILVRPGAQVHFVQILTAERLFEISGVVQGAGPDGFFNLMLSDPEGNVGQKRIRTNPKTGEFQMQGVHAGKYLLRATAESTGNDGSSRPRSAWLPMNVTSDVSGIVLSLGRGISVGVQVRDEISIPPAPGVQHQVMIHLTPTELSRYGPTIVVPPAEGQQSMPSSFDDLVPDTYEIQADPAGFGYVAELRCGRVDLFRDDLVIAPGGVPAPIEVTLRDDGASLTVNLQNESSAVLVLYSPDYPKRSRQWNAGNTQTLGQLPPGTYKVLALENADDLEIRNPTALQPFLTQAKDVTLHPGDNVTIRLQVQSRKEAPE